MSLNRVEQKLFEYVLGHVEERQHWQTKVREAMGAGAAGETDQAIAGFLADELWQYYVERRRSRPPLREADAREEVQRISLRNLAEYLMRIWGPIRPLCRDKSEE